MQTNNNRKALKKIKASFDNLMKLEDGWDDDGYCKAFSKDWLISIKSIIEKNYPVNLPELDVGANIDGGIDFEWENKTKNFLLRILVNHSTLYSANFIAVDILSDKIVFYDVDISSSAHWDKIARYVLDK